MKPIISITSVSQIHQLLGLDPPEHSLITLLEDRNNTSIPKINGPIPSELYAISLKTASDCSLMYGRRNYDFQEGSLLFLAPGQSFTPSAGLGKKAVQDIHGWTLVFHPELIRNSALANEIETFSFFRYTSHEALHLSEQERVILAGIIQSIKDEYTKSLDEYSNSILVALIGLFLTYCQRFFGRQFITRKHESRDILMKFESYLGWYFGSYAETGPGADRSFWGAASRAPLTVQACAREMGYSPNYFSDLLKRETGKTALEHIYFFVLDRAMNKLVSSDESVQSIATSLGFEYSQHFSKFFKSKIGVSPTQYRKQRLGRL